MIPSFASFVNRVLKAPLREYKYFLREDGERCGVSISFVGNLCYESMVRYNINLWHL